MSKENTKLQAQLDADAAESAKLANFAAAKAASLSKMRLLGQAMAEGAGAITDGAFEFGSAVLSGLAKEENAFDWYQAIAYGFNDKAAEFHQDAMPTDATGLKQSVSIFRTFGRSVVVAVIAKCDAAWDALAKANPDVAQPHFYARVERARNGLTKEARAGSVYNSMAVANRRITDAIEGGKAIADLVADLTGPNGDKLIEAWVSKEIKRARTLPEVLRKLAQSMESKAESTGYDALLRVVNAAVKAASEIEVIEARASDMQLIASREAAAIIEAASVAAE